MEDNNVYALDPSGMNLNVKKISCILLPSQMPNHHRTLQVAPRWCSLVVCQMPGITRIKYQCSLQEVLL